MVDVLLEIEPILADGTVASTIYVHSIDSRVSLPNNTAQIRLRVWMSE